MTIEPKATKDLSLPKYGSQIIDWTQLDAATEGDITQAPGTGGPDRHTSWLATTRPDGRPHVRAVGAQKLDDAWWFTSSPDAQKARNIAHDPRCSLSIALDEYDLTVEGTAERVTDVATLEKLAAVYAGGGWPAEVRGDAFWAEFSAPSAGPPPWHLYRIVPSSAVALSVHEGGATSWRF